MGEQNAGVDTDLMDDIGDSIMADIGDDILPTLAANAANNDPATLAAKRRKMERQIETLRLRDELGDYEFEFGDDYQLNYKAAAIGWSEVAAQSRFLQCNSTAKRHYIF